MDTQKLKTMPGKLLLFSCLLALSFPSLLFSQKIKTVQFTQGKLIGALPYGQHFYIQGSTKLPKGNADKVEILIFDAGSYKKKEPNATLSEAEMANIIAGLSGQLVNRSEWNAYRVINDKTDVFKAYIDAVLRFNRKYLVVITYSKKFAFTLTPQEKTTILNSVVDGAIREFSQNEQISLESIQELLNDETFRMLKRKAYAENEVFFSAEDIRENLPNVVIEEPVLDVLREDVGQISSDETIIDQNKVTIAQQESKLLTADSSNVEDIKEEIQDLKEENARRERNVREMRKKLDEKLTVIKNQMVVVGRDYVVGSPSAATSVTEVNSIGVGTSFGGGVVGLNPFDANSRETDAFGYSAVKFFLSPVDKRVANPYLDDKFFINRLAILVGVSTTGDYTYRGQTLEKALNFNPLLGFSYDVNRSLSIDGGATLFKQPSISPLQNRTDVRVGPVIGVNLDIDGFNRFSKLLGGEEYRIDPNPIPESN